MENLNKHVASVSGTLERTIQPCDTRQLIITWMSNIKFKHNLFVPWTFKLVRYFTSINVRKADVKFLGCIDNQMFLPMELRHVDPPPRPPLSSFLSVKVFIK